MPEISGDDFAAAIANANLETALSPLVGGTSPELTPSQLLNDVVTAYHSVQTTYNENTTEPEKIRTLGDEALGPITEVNGTVYRTITRTMSVRKNFSEGNITSEFLII